MNKINTISIKGIIIHFLPIICLLLFSYNDRFRDNIYIIIGFICILPYSVYYYKKNGVDTNIIIFSIFILIGSLLNLVFTPNGIGGTILFCSNIFLMFYCIENIRLSRLLSLIVLCSHLFFIYHKIFIEMVDPSSIYESLGLSKNYPGFLLVIWNCFYGFTKYIIDKKVSIILPIFSCYIALFLDGRASLIVLFLMTFCLCCYKYKRYIIIFFIFIFSVLFIYWSEISEIYGYTSLAKNSLETARYEIWKTYIISLDLYSLIGGLDTTSIPLIFSYGGNTHNAFFTFHSRMGLTGLLVLVIYLIRTSLIYFVNNKYIFLLYLLCIVLRISFDSCINTTYDFILYFIIFFPFLAKKNQFCVKSPTNRIYKLVDSILYYI